MLATCLLEWFPPPEDSDQVDAEVAAFVIAEWVHRINGALTSTKKKR